MSWGRGYWVLFAALVAASFFYNVQAHANLIWYSDITSFQGASAQEVMDYHVNVYYGSVYSGCYLDSQTVTSSDSYGVLTISHVIKCTGTTAKTRTARRSDVPMCNTGYSYDSTTATCLKDAVVQDQPLELFADSANQFGDTACFDGTQYRATGPIITLPGAVTGGTARPSRTYFSNGVTCSADSPGVYALDDGALDGCVTGQSGNVVCAAPQHPQNCGSFNGELVCLDSVPSGNCSIMPGGSYICDSAATTPPKPNNGIEGSPAPVDDTLQAKSDTKGLKSYSYYSITTVNNSTTHQGVPVGQDGTSQDPTAEQTFEEVTDHSPYGNADITEADNITAGYGDPLDGAQIAQPAASRVYSWSGVGQACAVGDWSFEYMGYSLTMDLCPAWDMIQFILYWAFAVLTAWYLYEVWTHTFRRAA